MWYKNVFRRHLCDMHIDDWDDKFLSAFSPEKYLENLKKAKIQNAMLYFQSHVGLCYYPTACGKMHAAFTGRENMMQRLAAMCKDSGINVTGYYSLIYNNWAYDAHPEWRMITENGIPFPEEKRDTALECARGKHVNRYKFCCPNNLDYREFTAKQIAEICEYFTFDGMFFDMLFWPHVCCCESCQKRWREEVGGELPKHEDWNDERWLLNIRKRREWMGEFAEFAADEVRKHVPGASVYHNAAFAGLPDAKKALAEEVLDASDYAGGDLYGGIYAQSFVCKLYKNATKNQPFEYMFSRCKPTLASHTLTKSEDEMASAAFLTSAHHGATLVIDAIDPTGTMDSRVYDRVGKVFEKEIPYEKHLKGDMLEEIGVYYSLKSKFNPQGEGYTNHNSSVNIVKSLVCRHIPCGVTGTFHELDSYKLIAAPYLTEDDREDFERITDYVRRGGKLYISGGNCHTLLKEFFGAFVTGRTSETITYLSPRKEYEDLFGFFNADYPMHFDASAPIIEFDKCADVIANITLPYTRQDSPQFASIHSDPPGVKTQISAVICAEYGKGKVLWSALPLEDIGFGDYRNVFIGLLENVLGFESSLWSDAPDDVEIVIHRDCSDLTCAAVQLVENEKARNPGNFTICIKTERKPLEIELPVKNKKIAFSYENNILKFKSENLEIFDMYRIKF